MSGVYYKRKQKNYQLQTKQKNNSRTWARYPRENHPSFRPAGRKIFVSGDQLRAKVFKNLV